MRDGQALHTSPYVTQIEKYADSLKRLSRIFLKLEGKKQAFLMKKLRICLTGSKKMCVNIAKNAPGAGENILYIHIRWDMRFCRRWIIMEVN